MHVGIAGIGLYFPSTELSAAELAAETGVPEDVIALKFGIKRKPVAGPDDTTADMGYKAARKALEEAGVAAADVDLVIWCGAQHKDYPCWLPASMWPTDWALSKPGASIWRLCAVP